MTPRRTAEGRGGSSRKAAAAAEVGAAPGASSSSSMISTTSAPVGAEPAPARADDLVDAASVPLDPAVLVVAAAAPGRGASSPELSSSDHFTTRAFLCTKTSSESLLELSDTMVDTPTARYRESASSVLTDALEDDRRGRGVRVDVREPPRPRTRTPRRGGCVLPGRKSSLQVLPSVSAPRDRKSAEL